MVIIEVIGFTFECKPQNKCDWSFSFFRALFYRCFSRCLFATRKNCLTQHCISFSMICPVLNWSLVVCCRLSYKRHIVHSPKSKTFNYFVSSLWTQSGEAVSHLSTTTLKPLTADMNKHWTSLHSAIFCWETLHPDVHAVATWQEPSTHPHFPWQWYTAMTLVRKRLSFRSSHLASKCSRSRSDWALWNRKMRLLWSAVGMGWALWVKEQPHESQDPGFFFFLLFTLTINSLAVVLTLWLISLDQIISSWPLF